MPKDAIEAATVNRKGASQFLGIAENTLVKLLSSGRIKYIKCGRRTIISKKELQRFLDEA